jgi:hypothetical protein
MGDRALRDVSGLDASGAHYCVVRLDRFTSSAMTSRVRPAPERCFGGVWARYRHPLTFFVFRGSTLAPGGGPFNL